MIEPCFSPHCLQVFAEQDMKLMVQQMSLAFKGFESDDERVGRSTAGGWCDAPHR
jgi:hypothetical protein